MTKKILPGPTGTEEAQWHQTLVELLEHQDTQYDIAIKHVAVIAPDRWGVRYLCVPKEGVVGLTTVQRFAGVALNAGGAPSSVLWSDLLPDDPAEGY